MKKNTLRLTINFSSETMEAGRKWYDTCKVLEFTIQENYCS